jgi:beta-glucanase (GH16 family)
MARVLLLFLIGTASVLGQARIIWQDEFDGAAGAPPDPTKWTYDLGAGGWGNHELETYTAAAANIQQDGKGHLLIRGTKDATGAYASARIKTQGRFSFTYGRAEARMKLPHGQGMWPAFWMLGDDISSVGWPKCGEVDVMENIGREAAVVHGTIHGPGYSGKNGIGAPYTFPSGQLPAEDFHVYAVDWRENKIDFLVDGHVYETVTPESLPHGTKWVYDHPFFLLLNLAIGGAWPGNPDASTEFSQELVVDWVRVYAQP